MAHWGVAMTHFYQLWDPPLHTDTISTAQQEIQQAQKLNPPTKRENQFINALALVYQDATRPLSHKSAQLPARHENSRRRKSQRPRSANILRPRFTGQRFSLRQNSRQSKTSRRSARTTVPRLPAAPRNSPLPHPRLRQRRTRFTRTRRRPRLFRDRAFSPARTAHALAHFHSPRPLG